MMAPIQITQRTKPPLALHQHCISYFLYRFTPVLYSPDAAVGQRFSNKQMPTAPSIPFSFFSSPFSLLPSSHLHSSSYPPLFSNLLY
jgi:hypothetical protein